MRQTIVDLSGLGFSALAKDSSPLRAEMDRHPLVSQWFKSGGDSYPDAAAAAFAGHLSGADIVILLPTSAGRFIFHFGYQEVAE